MHDVMLADNGTEDIYGEFFRRRWREGGRKGLR